MAERNGKPQIVLIDTNVIIEGAIGLANNVDSSETRVWSALLRGELKAAFSDVLLAEVVVVARRLMGKDFASKLRSQILGKAEALPKGRLSSHVSQFSGRVPKEDVAHAALAAAVGGKYIISNNREFLRSLKGRFRYVTPKSFVATVHL